MNHEIEIDEHIRESANYWYKEVINFLESEYSVYLSSFLKSNISEQINETFQNTLDLTLHQIHPSLRAKSESVLSVNDNFSQIVHSSFSQSKLSKHLRSDLTLDEKFLFYKHEFQSYIKRYYLLGKMDWEISLFLYVYKNGFISLRNHLSLTKWEQLVENLNYYHSGSHGIQYKPWSISYNSTYLNFENREASVWLAGFKDKSDPSMNYYYGPLAFMKLDNLNITEFLIDKSLLPYYLESYNESENIIRKSRNLPLIGEGWISETKLFYLIKDYFIGRTVVLHHGKPNWLGRQHFDIYIPEFNLALEYQGEQHYQPIDFFGGKLAFEKNKTRDERKRELAKQNNCKLIYVDKTYTESEVIQEIELYISKFLS